MPRIILGLTAATLAVSPAFAQRYDLGDDRVEPIDQIGIDTDADRVAPDDDFGIEGGIADEDDFVGGTYYGGNYRYEGRRYLDDIDPADDYYDIDTDAADVDVDVSVGVDTPYDADAFDDVEQDWRNEGRSGVSPARLGLPAEGERPNTRLARKLAAEDIQDARTDRRRPAVGGRPSGETARVAIDYDGDGLVDRVADVPATALDRMLTGRGGDATTKDSDGPGDGTAKKTLDGKIQSLSTVRLAGDDGAYSVVKLETDDGAMHEVFLGPAVTFREMVLRKGETLAVTGRPGRVDGRSILLAEYVEHGEQTATVTPPRTFVRLFKGEVTEVDEKTFGSHDDTFVVARVELADDRRFPVLLGAKSKVADLGISDGDRVAMLARRGRINGRPALIAQEIRFNDMTTEVSPPSKVSKESPTQRTTEN